jgi:hypothetical protein
MPYATKKEQKGEQKPNAKPSPNSKQPNKK